MYAGETERKDRKTAAFKRRASYTAKERELDGNQTKHGHLATKKKLENVRRYRPSLETDRILPPDPLTIMLANHSAMTPTGWA